MAILCTEIHIVVLFVEFHFPPILAVFLFGDALVGYDRREAHTFVPEIERNR
jgi:hypothetical protein